eukprot:1192280-Prorocentrum_minimum.AAC.1
MRGAAMFSAPPITFSMICSAPPAPARPSKQPGIRRWPPEASVTAGAVLRRTWLRHNVLGVTLAKYYHTGALGPADATVEGGGREPGQTQPPAHLERPSSHDGKGAEQVEAEQELHNIRRAACAASASASARARKGE